MVLGEDVMICPECGYEDHEDQFLMVSDGFYVCACCPECDFEFEVDSFVQ
jgi:hypothetical protein